MGSNNVREKAEAAYDALDMREKSEIAAQHPRYCYAKGYTAALAVAPATAAHPSSMPPGFDWNPPCPDDAPTRDVLLYALRCAKAWEPGARILGNLRACDLSRALTDTLTAPAPPVGSPETCPTCGSAVRFSTEIACASGAWTDPWHHATPTPPGAAPDAASGPKAPPRMPAPADAGAERAVVEAARNFLFAFDKWTGREPSPCDSLKIQLDTHATADALRAALRGTKGA